MIDSLIKFSIQAHVKAEGKEDYKHFCSNYIYDFAKLHMIYCIFRIWDKKKYTTIF